MEKNLEELFAGKERKRDIEICTKCQWFHNHDGKTFGCGNVLKGHGHPWCAESYESLPKEYFERAHIFIADEKECLQNRSTKEIENV